MTKKQCLNFLQAVSTQEPISLSTLTPWSKVSQELKLKPNPEIIGKFQSDLEKKALQAEQKSTSEGFSIWFKSIPTKLSTFRGSSEKVQKFILQYLEALYSQIVFNLDKKSINEYLKILGSLTHKKYKLPDNERAKCKIKYNIYLANVYLSKGKLSDCFDCIHKVMEVNQDPFEAICCFNILALHECRMENHLKALEFHNSAHDLCKQFENPVYRSVALYNLTTEFIHLEDFVKSKETIRLAFDIAERNKNNKNLIFSKILLLYQEICGKDLKKDSKISSVNTLKKKTLEFMLREKKDQVRPREISLTRGRQANPDPAKIISLGNKFSKKRSKTEHGPKAFTKTNKNKEIFQNIKKNSAAILIQRAWKTFKQNQQKKLKNFEKSENSKFISEHIQKIMNRLIPAMASTMKKAQKKVESKIIKIQSVYRKFSCEKKLKETKKSARKIQAFVKGKKCRMGYLKILRAVVKIQAFYRGCADRIHLKKCQRAALVIQKQAHIYLKKVYIERNWKFFRFVRKSVFVAIKSIGKEIRNSFVEDAKDQTVPIVKIQAFVRMVPKRLYFKILKISACCIQRYVRGYLQRKNLDKMQKSALKIQKFLKSKFPQVYDYEISCY